MINNINSLLSIYIVYYISLMKSFREFTIAGQTIVIIWEIDTKGILKLAPSTANRLSIIYLSQVHQLHPILHNLYQFLFQVIII